MLKKILFLFTALTTLAFSGVAIAEQGSTNNNLPDVKHVTKVKLASSDKTNPQAYALLLEMQKNIKESNYKLIFTTNSDNGRESYSYTNIFLEGKRYAKLTNLEGDKFFVILKDGLVGYSQYSIESNNISDVFPSTFNADYEKLATNYIFTLGDTVRVADHEGQVVDITNKYSNLFSYQLVIDKESKLPLKITLVEHELSNNSFVVINTFTVQVLTEGLDEEVFKKIKKTDLNKNLIFVEKINQDTVAAFDKLVNFGYVPSGFKLATTNSVTMYGNSIIAPQEDNLGKPIEYFAMTYYDGLFTFTLFISKTEVEQDEQFFMRTSDISFYSESYGNHKLIVLGQVPLNIAKGIVNTIDLYDAQGNLLNLSHKDGLGTRIDLQ